MNLGMQVSTVVLRRRASVTMAILAVVAAGSFVLGRSQSTPQVSAAQMEQLTGSLAAAPDHAAEHVTLRNVSQSIFVEPGTSAAAAVDYYLKIDGIEGSASHGDAGGMMDIQSWSWGETNTLSGVGGGKGAGKVSMSSFNFVMKVGKASPQLMLAVATGQHIREATLIGVRRSDGQQVLMYKLKGVVIFTYDIRGSSGEPVPTDQISLNFTKIEFTVWPQLSDGKVGAPVTVQYDLKLEKKP